jgi:carboxyl-terminal processing protease
LFVVLVGGWPGGARTPQSARADVPADSVALRSCDRILQGRFDEAFDILDAVPDEQLTDDQARKLKRWLTDYHAISTQRIAFRTKEFNRFAGRANTLMEELTDPQYARWMIEVLRAHGLVFDPESETAEDDTSDDDASKDDAESKETSVKRTERLRVEFTAAVEAALAGLGDTDPALAEKRERYRRWALADFERFDDGRITSLSRLAAARSAPGLAGVVVDLVQRVATSGIVLRLGADPVAPRPGLRERIEKIVPRTKDDDFQPFFDALAIVGFVGNPRTALLGDTLAELVFPTTLRPTLGRTVVELYRRDRALNAAQAAMVNADDEDTFRNTDWVRRLSDDAEAEAIELTGAGKWGRAMRLYAGLEELHPRNKAYRDGRIACVSRVRIERFYSSSSRWADDLEKIDTDMVRDGMIKVAQQYVVSPDFKEIVLSGLRAVLLLTEEPKLPYVFPKLGDELETLIFIERVKQNIKEVRRSDGLDLEKAMKRFRRLMEINDETIDLPSEVIINEFMLGALEPLDRFSSVIWPAEVDEFRKRTLGKFFGVGIQITIQNGWLTVVQPLDDTPAYRKGIAPGEVIAAIDGETTKDMAIEDAVKKITGDEGTEVVLTVRSANDDGEERDVALKREAIKINSVKGERREDTGKWDYFIDEEKKVAYIRVTAFMEQTVDDVKENLNQLIDQGAEGLILDLRFNPGGLLRTAVDMCDLFLPAGKSIVSTKGEHSRPASEEAAGDDLFPNLPLIVLVNGYSASASEIVAGALQDNDNRALILGERTFGKGSVQNLYPIGDYRAYLKLTTAHYYLPSGRLVHKTDDAETWGVDPDVPIKLVPREVSKIMQLGLKSDLLRGKKENEAAAARHKNGDEESEEADKEDADDAHDTLDDELPDVDPQLEAALLVMRAHLISRKPWPVTAHVDTNGVKTQ